MKNKIIIIFLLFLFACDGAVEIKIYTYENNSVSGFFEKDTILDGKPVSNVKVKVLLADYEENTSEGFPIEYEAITNDKGYYFDDMVVPPFQKERKYIGYIIPIKEGYKTDTLIFTHSSFDKRVCIINMEKEKKP